MEGIRWMVTRFECQRCRDWRYQKSWFVWTFLGYCIANYLSVTIFALDFTLILLFSVKDGVFRHYNGPRDKEAFITFIEEKQWSMIEPIPSYKNPDSPQMAVVALFFKLSMAVRDFHNHLVENVGIPSWASYSMFAVVTLGLGCILGFVSFISRFFKFNLKYLVHCLYYWRRFSNWSRYQESYCCCWKEEAREIRKRWWKIK